MCECFSTNLGREVRLFSAQRFNCSSVWLLPQASVRLTVTPPQVYLLPTSGPSLFFVASFSHLRLFALSLVRIALGGASAGGRKAENSSLSAHTATTTPDDAPLEDWCIAALVEQLNGDDAAVARAALSVLEEATHDERCLRTLVSSDSSSKSCAQQAHST